MPPKCQKQGCTNPAMEDRRICEFHAFPAARTYEQKRARGRRAAVEATKNAPKVSDQKDDE